MNIFIGNIPSQISEEELRQQFVRFGAVHSVKLVIDPVTRKPRGYGFIEMSTNSAQKAIEELDGINLCGRKITVNEASGKKQSPANRHNNRFFE